MYKYKVKYRESHLGSIVWKAIEEKYMDARKWMAKITTTTSYYLCRWK